MERVLPKMDGERPHLSAILSRNGYRSAPCPRAGKTSPPSQGSYGWDYGDGPEGNDMGIVRDGGRTTHNFREFTPGIIYRDAKEVVIVVPSDALE